MSRLAAGAMFVASAVLLMVAIHHIGKSFRHGRPVDATISGGALSLATVLYLGFLAWAGK